MNYKITTSRYVIRQYKFDIISYKDYYDKEIMIKWKGGLWRIK